MSKAQSLWLINGFYAGLQIRWLGSRAWLGHCIEFLGRTLYSYHQGLYFFKLLKLHDFMRLFLFSMTSNLTYIFQNSQNYPTCFRVEFECFYFVITGIQITLRAWTGEFNCSVTRQVYIHYKLLYLTCAVMNVHVPCTRLNYYFS